MSTGFTLPSGYSRVRRATSFDELAATPFADGVNAVCWERTLAGDFGEVAKAIGPGEGIVTLDEVGLRVLPLSEAGRLAVEIMLADLAMLRARELNPALNCIHGYPRDEDAGPVATDVFSFHADRAPLPADTWLCTYFGPPSEAMRHEDAIKRVHVPGTRAELRQQFGGGDDEAFEAFLSENCYDLHYVAAPQTQPFSFGVGNLWRIAVEYPDCPVPPCIHRAPATAPGQAPRLLLIS